MASIDDGNSFDDIQTKMSQNAALPINRLPVEILLEIISFTLPGPPPWDRRFPCTLYTWVCHHWRAVVLSNAVFWSYIVSFRNEDLGHPFVKEALIRSQNAPLDILMSNNSVGIKALRPNAHRVKTLRMAGYGAYIPFRDVMSLFPSLENILLDTGLVDLPIENLPRVRALQVHIRSLGNLAMPNHFPELWWLKITYDISTPLLPLLEALQNLPNLRILHLFLSRDKDGDEDEDEDLTPREVLTGPILIFNQLEALSTDCTILQLITAPKLSYLYISRYPADSYQEHYDNFCGFDFSKISHIHADIHHLDNLYIMGKNQTVAHSGVLGVLGEPWSTRDPSDDYSVFNEISDSYPNEFFISFKYYVPSRGSRDLLAPFSACVKKSNSVVEMTMNVFDPSRWTTEEENCFLNTMRSATSLRSLCLAGNHLPIICRYFSDKTVCPGLERLRYSCPGVIEDPSRVVDALRNLIPVREGFATPPRRLELVINNFTFVPPEMLETMEKLGLRIIQNPW